MRSFQAVLATILALSAAACGPAPGSVLSSEIRAIPPGTPEDKACSELCVPDFSGCSSCSMTTLPDGGPAVLCEVVECGPPPTTHE